MDLSMTICRDYRTNGRYEYVIYSGEKIVDRKGFYVSPTEARRAVVRAAAKIEAAQAA